METKVQWQSEMEKARQWARSENKPLFLDFFNPQ